MKTGIFRIFHGTCPLAGAFCFETEARLATLSRHKDIFIRLCLNARSHECRKNAGHTLFSCPLVINSCLKEHKNTCGASKSSLLVPQVFVSYLSQEV